MIDFRAGSDAPIDSPTRDDIEALDDAPLVVSISDLHGYLDDARSALTAVGDHDAFEPVVDEADDGRLHWAGGEDYVLVFNGDLIDRGPDSEGVVELVERLSREAPDGHVRLTLGNHEWGALFPDVVEWESWFSGQRSDDERRLLCRAVADGDMVAAYEGYNFTYAHAGQPSRYQPAYLNDKFVDAMDELADAVGTDDDAETQHHLVEEYRRVLSLGRQGGRGFGASIAWLDFRYLPEEAPPQIVGHTRQDEPVQAGNAVCENVIRANVETPGGEGVLVESPDALVSLERTRDGGVRQREFTLPEDVDADD